MACVLRPRVGVLRQLLAEVLEANALSPLIILLNCCREVVNLGPQDERAYLDHMLSSIEM